MLGCFVAGVWGREGALRGRGVCIYVSVMGTAGFFFKWLRNPQGGANYEGRPSLPQGIQLSVKTGLSFRDELQGNLL